MGGRRDASFGENGETVTSLPRLLDSRQLMCLAGGGYLVAGTDWATEDQQSAGRVEKYAADGMLDTAFGVEGHARVEVGQAGDQLKSIDVDESGRIVVATGVFNSNHDFAVTRLNADGSLDGTFGTNGSWQLDIHSFGDNPTVTKVAHNGDVIVGGYTNTGSGTGMVMTAAGRRS